MTFDRRRALTMDGRIGAEFARAVAGKDRGALLALLEPRIDFRALTPGRPWEATASVEVVDEIILGHWFGPADHVLALLRVTTGAVADREHLAYRLRVRTGDVLYLVEQQVYYAVDRAAGSRGCG
ncbi:hypothetical protein [Actinomadura chibensis]|uniref:Nuclear transport factor 2 family protein n=1 Tax=Actinomadura chibensis TaxID=392828 RepID=A0A5D0NLW7_9ACTN|nr:hypothetical protein [Actinomadura chibensis]TYB45493.1 hypothetical protein FXF69_18855 [Actinomadura chibensis]